MIGFIGAAGNMAGAIINGIITNPKISLNEVCLFDRNLNGLDKFKNSDACVCNSINELVSLSDVIFLCAKPQGMPELLNELKQLLQEHQTLVSIAAGVQIKTVQSYFDFNAKIIRVMPNTPLMLGAGAAGLCHNEYANKSEISLVMDIFSSSGICALCDESQMNTVTAVSGSGPAYVFKFAKAVIEQAEELGLQKEIALQLFAQTLAGGAKMLTESGFSADELIKMVTSPNGTTQAANESFDANNFEDIVKQAVKACKIRADELSKA